MEQNKEHKEIYHEVKQDNGMTDPAELHIKLDFTFNWQTHVKAYCDDIGITPLELIEQHKYWHKMASDIHREAIKEGRKK